MSAPYLHRARKDAPALHNLGKPVKSRARPAGTPPGEMKGSNKLPAFVVDRPPRVVKVQVIPGPTHDARVQVGPGDEVPEHFSAFLPGIDPATGKPWGARA